MTDEDCRCGTRRGSLTRCVCESVVECEACGANATKVTADDVDLCDECYEEVCIDYDELADRSA